MYWAVATLVAVLLSYLIVTTVVWWLDVEEPAKKHSWYFYLTHPKVQMLGEE